MITGSSSLSDCRNCGRMLRGANEIDYCEKCIIAYEMGKKSEMQKQRQEEIEFLKSLPLAKVQGNTRVYKVNTLVAQRLLQLNQPKTER